MASSAGSIALALEGRAAMVTTSAVRTYGSTPVPRRPSGANAGGARPSAVIRIKLNIARKIVPARMGALAAHGRAFDSGLWPKAATSSLDGMARAPRATRHGLRVGACSRGAAVAQERLFFAPPSNKARQRGLRERRARGLHAPHRNMS